MASPSYGLDVIALAFAVVLAAAPRASSFPSRAAASGLDHGGAALSGEGGLHTTGMARSSTSFVANSAKTSKRHQRDGIQLVSTTRLAGRPPAPARSGSG